jgi:quinol monooxygenase YgiN
MVVMTIRVGVPKRKRQELFQTLQALRDSTRREQGCLTSRIYTETQDEDSVYLVEEWLLQSDLDRHIQSNDFAVLFGALTLLQSEPAPEVRILAPTGGLEAIEAVRKRSSG